MPYSCSIDAATAGLQAALSCYMMEGGVQDVHFHRFCVAAGLRQIAMWVSARVFVSNDGATL